MTKILAVAAVLFATITNAQAWGPREQGALAGIAGTLIFQHIANAQAQAQYPQQPPVVVGGYPQAYPQPVPQVVIPQQPRVIVVPQQPQVIIVPSAHGHRHGHYNGGYGYYQVPDPRVYNPQMF